LAFFGAIWLFEGLICFFVCNHLATLMPCFIYSSDGISAVFSARASCTLVQNFSARIAGLSKVSGTLKHLSE